MNGTNQHNRIKDLFGAAIDLPAAEREAFITEQAPDDPDVRHEVELLLVHHDERPPEYLESVVDFEAPNDRFGDAATLEGRFRILDQIGEGGMGAVYRARQLHPVQRDVAIKVIKLGMDTRQVIARFTAERQALARMNHRGIARVFDAGTTDAGRPFFAMELVQGVPITEYCDTKRLTARQRLHLFIDVCRAVQHAHQKGVIHRDLKPTNVLVDDTDEGPAPKVIDFGIAKAIDEPLAAGLTVTGQRQLVGTPAYMSPEQAGGLDDVDTRTDIYSLGVLLYELLTHTTPLGATAIRERSPSEIVRAICEIEPARPSARLASGRSLRGDLDWITLKALAKDRDLRYATASEFARDIERFLHDEPVLAGPPTARYRVGKFVRRHRAGVIAGTVVGAALLGAAGVSLGFALSESEQRKLATAAAVRAEAEQANTEAVNDFLTRDLLAAVAPSADAGRGRNVSMREVLDEAARRIDEAAKPGRRLAHRPLIEATIRLTLGRTYRLLGEHAAAGVHLERARLLRSRELGDSDPRTLTVANDLARLYLDQGRYDEAEPLFLETLETRRRVLGPEHAHVLESMNNLANLYEDQGRYDEAEALHVETLELGLRAFGDEATAVVESMANLANLYDSQARYDRAEPLYLATYEIRTRDLGEEHPSTLASMTGLGNLYRGQGRYDEALPLLQRALDTRRRIMGDEHPDTLWSMSNLAAVYSAREQFEDAEALFGKALGIRRRTFSDEHPDTLVVMNNMALVYGAQGRVDEAVAMYLEMLAIQKRVLGEDHPETLVGTMNLASVYESAGRFEDAVELQAQAVAGARNAWPEGSPFIGAFLANYGATLAELGRSEEAEPVLLEACDILIEPLGASHEWTQTAVDSLVKLYDEANRTDDAARWRAMLNETAAPEEPDAARDE